MKQPERATLAQICRIQDWFSVPGELLEKLTLQEARRFIGRVYKSRFTPAEMNAFKQEVLAMIKRREKEPF